MSLLTLANVLTVLICLAGCGRAPTGITIASETSIDRAPSGTAGSPADAPLVEPETVPLTYYRLSVTRAPVNGWITKTYTSTGYCATYGVSIYCWDDGVKTLAWNDPISGHHYGPYAYTYWNLTPFGTGYSVASGQVTEDMMREPRIIGVGISNRIPAATISQVFTAGTPLQAECTQAQGKLDCGEFLIDLDQAAL